ncbi:MAG: HDOD domain-containing protein [Polyangiaceae bacterium]|nr:HDOD domain-containing protein [Polyangiaceae bacterium]
MGSSDPLLNVAVLVSNVEGMFAAPHFRPPIVPALSLLALSQMPSVKFADVVALVEADSLFRSSALRLASAPGYASAGPARSVDQALLRVGLQALVDECVEAAMTTHVFHASGHELSMDVVRRHSIAAAHVSRLLSRRSSRPAENAFALGLLRNAALAAGIHALNTSPLWSHRIKPAVVWPVLVAARPELTRRLIRAWCLPPSIADRLQSHETVGASTDATQAAVLLGHAIADDLGFSLPYACERPIETDTLELCRAVLGLRLSEVNAVTNDARKLLERFY